MLLDKVCAWARVYKFSTAFSTVVLYVCVSMCVSECVLFGPDWVHHRIHTAQGTWFSRFMCVDILYKHTKHCVCVTQNVFFYSFCFSYPQHERVRASVCVIEVSGWRFWWTVFDVARRGDCLHLVWVCYQSIKASERERENDCEHRSEQKQQKITKEIVTYGKK